MPVRLLVDVMDKSHDKPGSLAVTSAAASPTGLATEGERIAFRNGQSAEVVRDGQHEQLLVRAVDGACIMRIDMTESGPVLVVQGAAVAVEASSVLSLNAKHLEVNADSVAMSVSGDFAVRARQIAAKADSGAILLHANDDVDIKGERVRLNSDDPPMPLSWEEFAQRKLERAQAGPTVLTAGDHGQIAGAQLEPPKQT